MLKRIMALCLVLLVCPALALAAQGLSLKIDEAPYHGGEYRIFRVGVLEADDRVVLDAPFAEIQEELNLSELTTQTQMATWISKLDPYTSRAAWTPVTTNVEGWVTYAVPKAGLYLVKGLTSVEDDGEKQTFIDRATALVAVPGWTTDAQGRPVYSSNRVIHPKISEREEPYTKLSVIKTWSSNVAVSSRPKFVTIALYRQDGVLIETVQITAEADWKHTFTHLDAQYTYYVKELNPGRFKVTYKPLTSTITEVHNADYPPYDRLTQSGQLWWPVYGMTVAGLALFVAGWMLRRRSEDER